MIQEWLVDLIPLEVSLKGESISQLDDHMIKACKELHAFITKLYTDMRDNPGEYDLIHENEEVVGRAMGVLRGFIWEMIPDGELMGDNIVWIRDFEQKANHHKGIAKLFSKTAYSVRQRLNFLERCGLHIEENAEGAYVTNTLYPNIFLPLFTLRKANERTKSGGWKNYAGFCVYKNCEFRLVADPMFKPTLEDVMYNRVSPDMKNVLLKIDEYAKQNNLKAESHVGECIYYMLKGKRIFNIRVRRHEVHVEISIGSIERINEMLVIYSEDFINFIRKNMNYCRNCFPHHGGGNEVSLFGKKIRICSGGADLFIKNPMSCQFENIMQAIDFGCKVV